MYTNGTKSGENVSTCDFGHLVFAKMQKHKLEGGKKITFRKWRWDK